MAGSIAEEGLDKKSLESLTNPSNVLSFTKGSTSFFPIRNGALDHVYTHASFTIPALTGFISTYRTAAGRTLAKDESHKPVETQEGECFWKTPLPFGA
jgi:hypothetical protein